MLLLRSSRTSQSLHRLESKTPLVAIPTVEMTKFAALPRVVDGIEKLEKQIKKKEDELLRLRKSLNLHKNA